MNVSSFFDSIEVQASKHPLYSDNLCMEQKFLLSCFPHTDESELNDDKSIRWASNEMNNIITELDTSFMYGDPNEEDDTDESF